MRGDVWFGVELRLSVTMMVEVDWLTRVGVDARRTLHTEHRARGYEYSAAVSVKFTQTDPTTCMRKEIEHDTVLIPSILLRMLTYDYLHHLIDSAWC